MKRYEDGNAMTASTQLQPDEVALTPSRSGQPIQVAPAPVRYDAATQYDPPPPSYEQVEGAPSGGPAPVYPSESAPLSPIGGWHPPSGGAPPSRIAAGPGSAPPLPLLVPRPLTDPPPFTPLHADADGRLHLELRPSCIEWITICPCFLFFGCCFLEFMDVDFNDTAQEVTIDRWVAWWDCCRKRLATIPYSDVANIGLRHEQNKHGDWYLIVLVTAGREKHRLGQTYQRLEEAAPEALAFHHFLFGRSNPHYTSPPPASLMC